MRLAGRQRDGQSGFTIIELMVVIAILALVTKIVTMNMASLIPTTALDSEASKISTRLDFLRAEARLNGKSYTLQIDLSNHRHRIILPPIDEMIARGTAQEYMQLEWMVLDEHVKFAGFATQQPNADRKLAYKGIIDITFDENGFTADQSIYLALRDEDDEKKIWTVHLHGLSGATETIRNHDGVRFERPAPTESSF